MFLGKFWEGVYSDMLAKAESFPPDYKCGIVTTKEFNQIKFVTTFIPLMELVLRRSLPESNCFFHYF